MSFDDYAKHIYQKHSLAVAITIIKSKPTNVETIQYLELLKSKIDHKMDYDDITVCSDDFMMNDDDEMNDSVTILKDFDFDVIGDDNLLKDFDVGNEVDVRSEKPQEAANMSQITYFDSQLTPENVGTNLYRTNPIKYTSNINHDIPIESNTKNLKDNNKDFNNIIHSDHNYSKTLNKVTIDSEYTKNTDRTYYDSQKTIPYTVHGFTQNSHYSESQNAMVIPSKYIYGTNKNTVNQNNEENSNSNVDTDTKYPENITNVEESRKSVDKIHEKHQNVDTFEYSQTMNMFSQRNDDDFDEIRSEFRQTVVDVDNRSEKIAKNVNKNTEIAINYSQNFDEYFDEIRTVDDFRQNLNNLNNTSEMDTNFNILDYKQTTENLTKNTIENNYIEKEKFSPNAKKHSQLYTNTSEIEKSEQLCIIPSEHDRSVTEEYESEEIISYKVLKEFNKVKTFLNKPNRRISCDGYSTDSGYRSDSQIRSSRGSLQLSGNWLNQSGCCLFNFIMTCPLIESTREITNEIAEVLGQLIEKLHEDEKYPSFLEELLEAVDLLIRQVYEGIDDGDNEFLKKDEHIQRILLLNKSYHIQQHSLENLSKLLEKIHSQITEQDSTYELTNIDKIENISYIFHILEILIKKYLKNKLIFSQKSSQSQDDEKYLKKSSITDIWRKKWNPSQKVFEGTREKKCVLKNCSEILNKIVVDCVSNYSLIAYSALKCFNTMQS